MFVGDRLLVVTDHEGSGRLYLLNDSPLRLGELMRHDFYVRHAATDRHTVVYVAGGELWSLNAEDALTGNPEPQRVDVELSGARQGRQPRMLALGDHRGPVAVDRTGRASAVECPRHGALGDAPRRALAGAAHPTRRAGTGRSSLLTTGSRL
jgi:tricorn protease